MTTLKEAVAVEVMGRPTHHARRSRARVAVVSLGAAVAIALSVSLATGNFPGGGVHALNPQPIPPGVHGDTVLALNPQPLPPEVQGHTETLA